MELTKSQKEAFSKAKEGQSLLVIGQGDTGKSALIEIIAKHLHKIGKQVALSATTGIASLDIGGQTIHSWSGIGDGRYSSDQIYHNLLTNDKYCLLLPMALKCKK